MLCSQRLFFYRCVGLSKKLGEHPFGGALFASYISLKVFIRFTYSMIAESLAFLAAPLAPIIIPILVPF